MNIRNSGKIPEQIKWLLAAVLVLLITLFAVSSGGIIGSEGGSESKSVSSIVHSSSDDDSTHVPVEDSSVSSVYSNSGGNSSEPASNSSDTSGGSSVPGISESNSGDSAGSSGESSSQAVSSVTSEPVSNPDPPVVVVPTISVPYSPGTLTAVGADGVIDYSNTSQGYIAVRYTGSNPKVKLQLSCNGFKPEPHDIPSDGTTVYIPLIFGNGTYNAYLGENVAGTSRYTEVVSVDFNVSLDSSLAPYLYPNMYANYSQGSDCVYKAAEVCAGKTSDIEKIAAVFGWITSNVTYDYDLAKTVKTGYVPDPNRTYSRRTGICFDYSSLMCAMLRSQSIPTRLVVGNASPDIRHAWNEVYTEETGWITPELLLKNAGYNIVDSTFYASSTNKSQIASYISNSVNYQAIHYY